MVQLLKTAAARNADVTELLIKQPSLMMRSLTLPFLLLLIVTGAGYGQAMKGTYALTNARIETITNGTIENGTLIIRDGKIESLGAGVATPGDAEVIDCSGMTIYPGLIDAGTSLGLVEISSLDETNDYDELGDVTPHVEALTAVNPNSVSIPVTRVSGVTTALTSPDGGLFPGTAALVNLHGYTPQQMYAGFRGVVLNFPTAARRGWWDDRPKEKLEKEQQEKMKRLNELWESAVLKARIDSVFTTQSGKGHRPQYVPEVEALVPVIRGELPLLLEVNSAKDIDSALAWIEGKNVRVILTGVKEGWRRADKIAAAGIPCIVGPVHTIPARESDRFDKGYANAGLLHQAGVTVALRSGSSANVRNLPFNAGFAAAYGMGKEQVLRAVTIIPAQLFGVADELGSLEQGKQATLFVASGDPFEPATDITYLFIEGYNVPATSRHVELYQEFLHRSPGLTK